MAKRLSPSGITTNLTIEAPQVSQSIDALTGIDDYSINTSGSFTPTGSFIVSGSGSSQVTSIVL